MSCLSLRSKVSVSLLFPIVMVVLAALATPAAAAELKVSVSGLSFIAVAGTAPAPQQFAAYASPAVSGFSPVILATTQTGSWLTVSSAAGGSFPSSVNVKVSVNSSSLSVGNYAGLVTVSQSGLTASPASIPVSLKVIPAGPYIAANPEALKVAAQPGIDPATAFLTVSNAGTGNLTPSFAASTSTGGSWLALSQATGGSFGNFGSVQVQIRSASLAPGAYTGVITVTAPGAANSPLNVPVTLTVGTTGGPAISVSPAALSFTAGLGANPPQQALTINNSGSGTLRPTITSFTADGGRWLVVNAGNGGSFGSFSTVIVIADITGLSKGTFTGAITVTDPSAGNSPLQIPVTLVVEDPKPAMRLNVSSLAFSTPVGGFKWIKFVDVFNTGTGVLKWTAVVTSQGPVPWLSISPSADEAAVDSHVLVIADSTSLPAGVYNGEVVFTASNAVSGLNPQKVSVILAVGFPIPLLNDGGIVNGANFSSAAVAPGSIVSLFGRNLGPEGGVVAQLVGGKLPTELGGVKVLFNGLAAPLFYAGDLQINAQAPLELAGSATVSVQVVVNNVPGQTVPLNLRPADPGIFLVAGKPAVFLNNTNIQVAGNVKAGPGDFLSIYATGLGALESAVETGAPAPLSGLVRTREIPRVLLGGVAVPVLFSGLAPGFVGLYQINILVPETVASGNNTLILAVGGAETAPMAVPIR